MISKNITKHNLTANNTICNPQNNKDGRVTRISNTNIKEQLGYIMISQKRTNWASNTRTKGIANINQNYQHEMLQIDITMKLKQNNDERSNNQLDYNINNLRNNPSETYIANGIGKDDIKNRIRTEENNKIRK